MNTLHAQELCQQNVDVRSSLKSLKALLSIFSCVCHLFSITKCIHVSLISHLCCYWTKRQVLNFHRIFLGSITSHSDRLHLCVSLIFRLKMNLCSSHIASVKIVSVFFRWGANVLYFYMFVSLSHCVSLHLNTGWCCGKLCVSPMSCIQYYSVFWTLAGVLESSVSPTAQVSRDALFNNSKDFRQFCSKYSRSHLTFKIIHMVPQCLKSIKCNLKVRCIFQL